MSETSHTPGPWHWRDDVNSGEYDLAPGVLTTNLSDGTPWGDEHDRANARIIAAAPDLLEALHDLINNNRKGVTGQLARQGWAKARAAISKAEGSQP